MADGLHIENLQETIRDLQRFGVDVSDIKAAFASIAAEGARLASGFAPRRTGRLAASVRGNKAKNKAVVIAGGARVPYGGPINYGWPEHHIAPSHFLQRADAALAPHAVSRLDSALTNLITTRGLI